MGAIIVGGGRILAARRSHPAVEAGRWEFPGGKVEPGELPDDALVREIREELGVWVTVDAEFVPPEDAGWPIDSRHVLRSFFASIDHGVVQLADSHDELRWLTPKELLSVDWLDADLPIATALSERGHRWVEPH